ncbi:MAG: Fe-S cluster assembly protein SufB, partial [Proteobacteria bacterium]|nr:Fe-S cluster assembly protein SufB [Pseudomonadota bacterium]
MRDAEKELPLEYSAGWSDPESYFFKSGRGLNRETVEMISRMKGEPDWMRALRVKSYDHFLSRKMPSWGADLSDIDFDEMYYYIKPASEQGKTWDDVPADIKNTFDKLGIPEAERKFLAGVSAQYESEVVYHSLREDLEKLGVIFTDMDSGLREHPEIVKRYFGTVIPYKDNKFAALNTAVWSGGSFVYVPKGVHVAIPLQAYFRINAKNAGQFERTLIIADEGSYVHYIEGCTAPIWSEDSLHSAVVELIAMKDATIRYTTVQNWSNNVYNIVTKRAVAHENATVAWIDGNLGSKVTMKYPAVYLLGKGAKAEIVSAAFANNG